MSSLDMQQQLSSLIAGNIANANTPGYAARSLPQVEQVSGGISTGVMAGTLQRLTNEAASTMANQTSGEQSYSQSMVDGLTVYTQVLGQPADTTSLSSQLSAFNQALTTLSATPDNAALQNGAVTAAQSLTTTFHNLSASVAIGREQADQNIASNVASVNQTLDLFARNEAGLRSAASNGQSIASYQDTREQLLSTLSQFLPLKTFANGNNLIVTTDQGTVLWDGSEHKLDFTRMPAIPSRLQLTADPANGYGAGLSSVTVDGVPMAMSQSGSIAANLQLRDVTLPGFGRQLDQMAGNTITAFQQVDPTIASGQTGIFTNNGAAVDPADPTQVPGLATNIAVNALVDPALGGQSWRMRDGAQAASQSASGDNSTVLSLLQAMNTSQNYDTKTGLPGSMTLNDATAQSSGLQQSVLATWAANNTARGQQAQEAKTALSNAVGVNVDEELQRLMAVQATYAATTQVIQAASKMLDDLLQMR